MNDVKIIAINVSILQLPINMSVEIGAKLIDYVQIYIGNNQSLVVHFTFFKMANREVLKIEFFDLYICYLFGPLARFECNIEITNDQYFDGVYIRLVRKEFF